MIRTPIVATVTVALLLAVPALAEQRYRDATGENPSALDIASANVSNDATTGDVGFDVFLAHDYSNLATELEGKAGFDIFIDSDRNRATGDSHGFDAEIAMDPNGGGIMHWNGKQMVAINGTTTAGHSDNSFYVYVARKDILLRHPRQSFNFAIVTHRLTSGHDAIDRAPNQGVYTYKLAAAPPPPPVVSTTVAVTVAAAAGERFQVGQFSATLANGTTAPIADQHCAASIAGKPLHAIGADHCAWLLPKPSRGKYLVVTVRGHYRAHRYSKRLSYRIA